MVAILHVTARAKCTKLRLANKTATDMLYRLVRSSREVLMNGVQPYWMKMARVGRGLTPGSTTRKLVPRALSLLALARASCYLRSDAGAFW